MESTYEIARGTKAFLTITFTRAFLTVDHYHIMGLWLCFGASYWQNTEQSERNESTDLFRAHLFCSGHHSVPQEKLRLLQHYCMFIIGWRYRLKNTLHTWATTFHQCILNAMLHKGTMTFSNPIFFSLHHTVFWSRQI